MEILRIKEIAKEKGMTMQDIAEQIGINRVNLSNSLNGNPTLERLKQVADCLGVPVRELFRTGKEKKISGYLEYDGEIVKVTSLTDLQRFLDNFSGQGQK